MTHMGPMPDSAGVFGAPEATQAHCRKCDAQQVTCQAWDSNDGAFTDYRYECQHCGHRWWIEGPDA